MPSERTQGMQNPASRYVVRDWTGKKTQFSVTEFMCLTVSYQVRINMLILFVLQR